MTVEQLVEIILIILIVGEMYFKCKKNNWSIAEYAIERSLGIWLFFGAKMVILFVCTVSLLQSINWDFMEYKLF